jgi:ribosomal protein L37AE/L43A
MSRPCCRVCQLPIEGPRIVSGGLWICADCAYVAEHGDVPRSPRVKRKKQLLAQAEALFPPEKYTRP